VILGRRDDHSDPVQGNLLLTHLFGAEVQLVDNPEEKEPILDKLRSEGFNVYNTSYDGYYLRSVSYVDGFIELHQQLQKRQIKPSAIYVCSGVHTHVGLVIGAKALGVDVRIMGISPSPHDNAEKNAELAEVANEVSRMMDLELALTADDIESFGEFAGEGYGILTEGSKDAVKLCARSEGLLLDPVYSGKAFAGLTDHIKKGMWGEDDSIVFVHTGGTPALFAYGEQPTH
jgi:1-aminocyclopropane-1-carboxylate deaminase/D-cysteine desulfhydrase-like pyridoxal-dependent ACC family enzyme